MKVIAVCGAHSGCGKTGVAEALLRALDGTWGALKYTKTSFYTSVSEEVNAVPDKDTERLKRAGAGRVVRVQSPPDGLSEPLGLALDMLSDCNGIVVEGNSPIEFLKPDIVIFVFGRDTERIKPSGKMALNNADIVVYQGKPPDKSILPDRAVTLIRYSLRNKEQLKSLTGKVLEKMAVTSQLD